jgi:hypothetical protein
VHVITGRPASGSFKNTLMRFSWKNFQLIKYFELLKINFHGYNQRTLLAQFLFDCCH